MTPSALRSDRIVVVSVGSTLALALTALLGLATASARPIAAVTALGMFIAGSVGMVVALTVAARRSRSDAIGIGGLFFLAGSAPDSVRRVLLGCLFSQIAIGLATAMARPYSSAAFGVLAPVAGLAACGLWAASHGQFGPRTRPPTLVTGATRDDWSEPDSE